MVVSDNNVKILLRRAPELVEVLFTYRSLNFHRLNRLQFDSMCRILPSKSRQILQQPPFCRIVAEISSVPLGHSCLIRRTHKFNCEHRAVLLRQLLRQHRNDFRSFKHDAFQELIVLLARAIFLLDLDRLNRWSRLGDGKFLFRC